MKKLISLILIVCLAALMVPAVADEDVTGTWTLIKAVVSGMEMDPSMMGMSMVMVLNADGTAEVTTTYTGADPDVQAGTWTLDGTALTITVDDQPGEFTFADGQITMEMSEGQMIFSKDGAAAPAEAKPEFAVIAAESEDVFFGSWKLSAAQVMGMTVPLEMLTSVIGSVIDISLNIEAGQAALTMTVAGDANAANVPTVLRDGALVLTAGEGEDAQEMVFRMSEAGELILEMEIGGQSFTLILTRAEEAAEEPAA